MQQLAQIRPFFHERLRHGPTDAGQAHLTPDLPMFR
jgi:hypothetical protein